MSNTDEATAVARAADLRSLAERVAKLEDVEAIKRLQARYASVCDARYDPAQMIRLFTPDGIWDGGEALGRVEGTDALYRHFEAASQQFRWAVHFMIAPSIEVHDGGATASGTWYLLEPATIGAAGEHPHEYWLATVYEISYRKQDGEWLFSEMKLNPKMWVRSDAQWGIDGSGGKASS
jgi:SnoaL-like domain